MPPFARRACVFIAVIVSLAGGATAAAQPAAIAARFDNGLIFVDVQVNGAKGLFMLDTGAAATVFDPRFADAAGVQLGRPRQVEGRGGDVAARQGDAVQLTLTNGPEARIKPVVTDLSEAARAMGVPLAGILGEDYLSQFVLTLDYRDQSVRMGAGAEPPADATPIRLGQAPYVRARAVLGDRSADGEFQIDTGSNTAIEFWRPFAASALGRTQGTADVGLGVAGESTIERGQIDALEVAGRRIVAPKVNFADETPPAADAGPRYAGVIGGPAWNGLILVLDLPDRLIWVR